MGFFDIKKSESELMNESIKNDYNRDNRSPVFPFTNASSITANSFELIDFREDEPRSAKYLPFNNLLVINNSASDILVFVNQNRDKGILVRAGDSTTIPSDVYSAVRSILYENVGTTTITAKQIRILVSKNNQTTDRLAESLHKLLNQGVRISAQNIKDGDKRI